MVNNLIDLKVSLDFGKSGLKAAYARDGKIKYFELDPGISKIPAKAYMHLGLEVTDVKDDAYLVMENNEYIIFGARHASVSIQEMKMTTIPLAFVAALGIILQREKLNPEHVDITTTVLLPMSEYGSKEDLEKYLEEQQAHFNFRGTEYSLKTKIYIRPEGSGAWMLAQAQNPDVMKKKAWVLMMGHRDLSILAFNNGSPATYACKAWQHGFSYFLEDVLQTTGLNLSTPAKHQALSLLMDAKISESDDSLKTLLSCLSSPKLIAKQLPRLKEAIDIQTAGKISAIHHELAEHKNAKALAVETIILTGGAMCFFETEMKQMLEELVPNVNFLTLSANVKKYITFETKVEEWRYIDALGQLLMLIKSSVKKSQPIQPLQVSQNGNPPFYTRADATTPQN